MHRITLLAAVAAATVLAGCGGSSAGPASASGPGFLVVAAENFWGSIAQQLAGTKATVRSVIVNPATDPHSYTPTAADTRLLAQSRMAVVNGIDYDRWASQALAANPYAARILLDLGRRFGLGAGANPHQWYSPDNVLRAVDAISAAYARLDPADAAYFASRRQVFLTRGLARYDQLIAEIRRRFAGVAVGYSESIFAPVGQALGLRLATPAGFAKAIAEGTDVSAQDKQTVDQQVRSGQIKVWVYNRQNVTPDVQRVTADVAARRIPIVTVTETLTPPTASFEDWQVAQLSALEAALGRATGR